MFASLIPPLDPASRPRPIRLVRIGVGLALIISVLAFAARLGAQQANAPALSIRPVVGAIVPVGLQKEAMTSSVVVGGQGAYALHPNVVLLGTFAWSPSEAKLSSQRPKLDLYQYDVGLEGRLDDLTNGAFVSTRPYAAGGIGGRTFGLRDVQGTSRQTDPLIYSAVGLELDQACGAFGLRVEARDNIFAFKGFRGELAERSARHDLQFSGGLTFRL
jgi:hypothetical protein